MVPPTLRMSSKRLLDSFRSSVTEEMNTKDLAESSLSIKSSLTGSQRGLGTSEGAAIVNPKGERLSEAIRARSNESEVDASYHHGIHPVIPINGDQQLPSQAELFYNSPSANQYTDRYDSRRGKQPAREIFQTSTPMSSSSRFRTSANTSSVSLINTPDIQYRTYSSESSKDQAGGRKNKSMSALRQSSTPHDIDRLYSAGASTAAAANKPANDRYGMHTFKSLNILAQRAIEILLSQHPDAKSELQILKRALHEQEEFIKLNQENLDAGVHKAMWESCNKLARLVNRVNEHQELIQTLFGRLDEKEKAAGIKMTELNHANHRIKLLQDEVIKKDQVADLKHNEYITAIARLERERDEAVEKLAVIEEKLKHERNRANGEKISKEAALHANQANKAQYAFYRDYYDQQEALYRSVFGKSRKPDGVETKVTRVSGRPIKTKIGTMPTIKEDEDMENRDVGSNLRVGAVRQVTQTLRTKYRTSSGTEEPLRGFEFLAALDDIEKDLEDLEKERRAERAKNLDRNARHCSF
ncbi:hypothetical protein M430DRAFT_276826 [Amorphotheca resinae ATCC 22711]|uniref:Uncharacterized protein n=1 Tax=Amorphotheca resinae ATCC 22711 TaxID=857342 RepID=A0A2T3B0Q9_AMORE|nr:hypothetical protein M430DRAFT_276826 [Amorphotheca resinae ATCC 22711]PSS16995.1 hypothetical protein M430DRAFT_276826 [Amorphotheca resinae ATCC 22711]